MKKNRYVLIILAVLLGVVLLLSACVVKNPTVSVAGGVVDEMLVQCPPTPNCVSSIEAMKANGEISEKYLMPIMLESMDWGALLDIVSRDSSAKLVFQDEYYAHFEFTSKVFKFVDDVELLYFPEFARVDFRSASRLGKSDLGVNKKRMLRIKQNLGL